MSGRAIENNYLTSIPMEALLLTELTSLTGHNNYLDCEYAQKYNANLQCQDTKSL